jgi:putative transposase
MLLSYKYRLYPNRGQRQTLNRILETHRQVYNAALQERRHAWKRCGVSIRYTDQANQLKELRAFDGDVAWCNYSSLQQTLRRLNKAFEAFFRRVKAARSGASQRAGYPRFKGRNWFKSVCYVYGDGIKLRDSRLYVQNAGLIRLFQHRPIPDEGTIKMAVLKRDRVGNWYVILQVELPDVEIERRDDPAVGIDMGLTHFATLSSGEMIENPRWFRESEEKLALLQRRRTRCKRSSHRYRELTRQIRRLHQRIANQRRDFQHQLSTRLVRKYGFIAVEDLNVKGLCRSHVSKSMGDAAWGQFLHMLAYKAAKAGTLVVGINPNGTSQICSGPDCGRIVPKTLSDRQHICPHCGFTAPRDVNAALNILARGRARTEAIPTELPELFLRKSQPPRKGFLAPVRGEVAGCSPL